MDGRMCSEACNRDEEGFHRKSVILRLEKFSVCVITIRVMALW
jgi:hypothetical protein